RFHREFPIPGGSGASPVMGAGLAGDDAARRRRRRRVPGAAVQAHGRRHLQRGAGRGVRRGGERRPRVDEARDSRRRPRVSEARPGLRRIGLRRVLRLAPMIRDLDDTIAALLKNHAPAASALAAAAITFDLPDSAWRKKLNKLTVNCYLYDVRENKELR